MKRKFASTISILSFVLASCGGGGGGSRDPQPPQQDPPVNAGPVFQTPSIQNLTVADIQRIIAQGVAEAQAQGQPSGFVVIDRVGNVLAVFVMNGTNLTLRTPPAPNGQSTDLQNLNLPAPAALAGGISKALTSSYSRRSARLFRAAPPTTSSRRPFRRRSARRAWRAARCSASSSASCPAPTSRRASRTAPAPIAARRSASAPIRAPSRSTRTASWSARSR